MDQNSSQCVLVKLNNVQQNDIGMQYRCALQHSSCRIQIIYHCIYHSFTGIHEIYFVTLWTMGKK